MMDRMINALLAKYGWVFMASNIFYPVYRDFVRGVMIGLLGP